MPIEYYNKDDAESMVEDLRAESAIADECIKYEVVQKGRRWVIKIEDWTDCAGPDEQPYTSYLGGRGTVS